MVRCLLCEQEFATVRCDGRYHSQLEISVDDSDAKLCEAIYAYDPNAFEWEKPLCIRRGDFLSAVEKDFRATIKSLIPVIIVNIDLL